MRMSRHPPMSWKRALPALVLLSLSAPGCGLFPEQEPGGSDGGVMDGGGTPPDTTAPTNVRITGGVTAGETVTGSRTLQAVAEDDSGTVARMEFLVDDKVVCTDATAKASGAAFSCAWNASQTPQGAHQLTARASDAAGNPATSPAIAFNSPAPNRVPDISRVAATPTSIDEGGNTSLEVSASDPDGDALSYAWTQTPATPAGAFSGGSGASRTWTAPLLSTNTTFTLKVTVTDARGGSVEQSVAVVVANVPGLNRPPTVDATIAIPARVVAGDTAALSIGATDPDGDRLTYQWTRTGTEGLFTDTTAATARWRSVELSAARTYAFSVTVSDGRDSVTRSVDLSVQVPQYAQDIQPLWDGVCTGCHAGSSGPRGGLTLEAGSSYASLVNKTGVGSCSAPIRVKPGEPDNSYLVKKITGATCGGRMPQGNTSYYDDRPGDVIRIRSWILAGAPNN